MNMLTDLIVMLIPLPVITNVQVSLPQRLGLYLLFGLGIFCMIAAVLRVVFVFALNQSGISAMWSIREDFVAVFVGQAPMLRPIFTRGFWTGENDSYGKGSKAKSYGNRSGNIELDSNPDHSKHSRKGSTAAFGGGKKKDPYSVTQIMSESQEEIVKGGDGDMGARITHRESATHLTVNVQRTVQVESRETTADESRVEHRVERWV